VISAARRSGSPLPVRFTALGGKILCLKWLLSALMAPIMAVAAHSMTRPVPQTIGRALRSQFEHHAEASAGPSTGHRSAVELAVVKNELRHGRVAIGSFESVQNGVSPRSV